MEKKKETNFSGHCIWINWSIQPSKTFAVSFAIRFPIKDLRPDWDIINTGINIHRYDKDGITGCGFVGNCACDWTQLGGNELMNTIFEHLKTDADNLNELIDNRIYAKLAEFKE
jgi:hypothetical protein